MKNKVSSLLYLIVASIPLLYSGYCYFPLDFWNDEIYTLNHFTFTHWATTLADYHVPNNHIFFNLLNKITLSIAGITTLDAALQYHPALRILPLTTGIFTLWLVFKIADQFFHRNAAWISVALLIASIPWQNHFLQIRGYGLSTLLLSLNLYLTFNAFDSPGIKTLSLLSISSACLLYTIPLNMYYILPVIFISLMFAVLKVSYSDHTFRLDQCFQRLWITSEFRVAIASSLGIILGLVFYAPVISYVFDNDIVNTKVIPPVEFFSTLDLISSAFLNKRYFIIPISIAGGLYLFSKCRINEVKMVQYIVFIMALYIFPFAIAAIREDPAPDRSFVMLAPVFALLMGTTAYKCLQLLNTKYIPYAMISILIYNSVISIREIHLMHDMLRQDIIHNIQTQNVNRSYYLAHFEPHTGVRIFSYLYKKRPAPVIIHTADYHSIRGYLDFYHIPCMDTAALDSLNNTGKDFYLIHTSPVQLQKILANTHPNIQCIQLLSRYDFHNYFFCRNTSLFLKHS